MRHCIETNRQKKGKAPKMYINCTQILGWTPHSAGTQENSKVPGWKYNRLKQAEGKNWADITYNILWKKNRVYSLSLGSQSLPEQKVENPLKRVAASESLLHFIYIVHSTTNILQWSKEMEARPVFRVKSSLQKLIPSQSSQILDITNQDFKTAFTRIFK